jgi:hypothetical protein
MALLTLLTRGTPLLGLSLHLALLDIHLVLEVKDPELGALNLPLQLLGTFGKVLLQPHPAINTVKENIELGLEARESLGGGCGGLGWGGLPLWRVGRLGGRERWISGAYRTINGRGKRRELVWWMVIEQSERRGLTR